VFSVDSSFMPVAYLECAIVGMIISMASGVAVSLIFKLRIRGAGIAIDAFLGATAPVITVDVLWRLGFRYNCVAAIILAVALPSLRLSFRSRRQRYIGQ
jgi:hypothetical protein